MSRLTKNIAYNLVGQGLLLVLGLVAVKFVFHRLGGDALGLIYAAATLATVLAATLELGISSTTVREVAAHLVAEPEYVRRLIGTATLIYWGLYAGLALAVYLLVPPLVTRWITLQTMDTHTAIDILRLLGISSLLVLPRSLYTSVFRGLQRMEFNNGIDVAVSAAQQGGTALILFLGGGLYQVAYWFAACFVVGILAYLVITARLLRWRTLRPGWSPAVIRRNLRFSLHMTSISVLSTVHSQSDKLLVSKLLPVTTFGYYAFAAGVVARGMVFTGAIAQAAFPSFSALHRRHDRAGLLAQYRQLHDLLCFATVPVFAALSFAALPLFTYLFREDIAYLLLAPTILLCVGFYMNGTLNIPYVFSLALGRPDISSASNFLALFVVLPIAVALVYFFGLTGAALSWVVYHLFAYSYAVRRICRECLELPPSGWYGRIGLIGLLAAATYGLGFVLSRLLGSLSLPSLALAYVAATGGFAAGAAALMDVDLRHTLIRLAQPWKTRQVGSG